MRLPPWLSLLLLLPFAGNLAQLEDEALDAGPDVVASPPEVKLDADAQTITRYDAESRPKWTTKLDGRIGFGCPPHLVLDHAGVYVTHQDGVTALDADTGKINWHMSGPSDHLLLSDELLLATASCPGENGRALDCWLVARSIRDGSTLFKAELPVRGFDSVEVEEFAGLFAVQCDEVPGDGGDAWLLDRRGVIRHRFHRQVIAGCCCGEDRLFLTSSDVVRLSPENKTAWVIAFDRYQWVAGGGLVELAGGDVLAFRYGQICDSGVSLIRFTPASGKVVWRTHAARLEVGHSKYRHRGEVTIRGETLRVTSRGSHGTFVELRDLGSGELLKRRIAGRE